MPSSSLPAAPRVIHLVWEIQQATPRPLRVLDVGPGWGKYERLLREYVEPELYIAAVEAWAPYVDRFGLVDRYDLVIVGDALDQPAEVLDRFDVILMVDVLEHMPKPEALAFLDRVPGWVIINTPRDHFDNPPDLPPTEAHVSHWTLGEFQALDRFDGHAPTELATLGALIVRLRPRTE